MRDDREILLQARRFTVVRHTHRTAGGETVIHETVQHPGAVAILPVLADGRVCLIRNYRVAVDRTLIELPAGTLEPGEAPAVTAERELAEETGYRAAKIEQLCQFYMSPGILNERMTLFLATDLIEGAAHRESGEEIENLLVSWDDAMGMARDGEIQDAKSLVGLLYFDAFRRLSSAGGSTS